MANLLVQENNLKSIANAIRTKNDKITPNTLLTFPNDFITNINNIETGAPLNFEIVGGISRPKNPKENTIWINTAAEITAFTFATIMPELIEGEVYIATSSASVVEFNSLKKNRLMVYPTSCAQKVNGVIVSKNAEIYKNGTWHIWRTYLYNSGKELVPFVNGVGQYNDCHATKTVDHVEIKASATGAHGDGMAWISTDVIDLSLYAQLNVEYENLRSTGEREYSQLVLGTSSKKNPGMTTSQPHIGGHLASSFVPITKETSPKSGVLSVAIDSIEKGSVLVGLYHFEAYNSNSTVRINKIWLV